MSTTHAQSLPQDEAWKARRKVIAAMAPDEVRDALLRTEIELTLTKIDLAIATKAVKGQAPSIGGWGEEKGVPAA